MRALTGLKDPFTSRQSMNHLGALTLQLIYSAFVELKVYSI